ncbi:uncharacterized protein LOC106168706 [Lingula anatina]|uniref:Uncharacterized protein LOC106168706 n=1 Tax=Lingula anatina TaxID=7574 RepID=A0A1S3IYN5_LINAN|nr:uncharacterized protein LOC106168706 [Lingula anatina]|eukprot:XP_013403320.1 uncharacterized protein LOC106168706 [Lingula anatina]
MTAKQTSCPRRHRRHEDAARTEEEDEEYMHHHIVLTEDWLRELQVATPLGGRDGEEEDAVPPLMRQIQTNRREKAPQRGQNPQLGFFEFPRKRLEKKMSYRFINFPDEGGVSSKVARPSRTDLERELPELVTGALKLMKKKATHKDLLYVKKPFTKHSRSLSFPQPTNVSRNYVDQNTVSGYRLPSHLPGDVNYFPARAQLPNNGVGADTDTFVRAWVQSGSATDDFLNKLDCPNAGRENKSSRVNQKPVQTNVRKIDIKVPVDVTECRVWNKKRSTQS